MDKKSKAETKTILEIVLFLSYLCDLLFLPPRRLCDDDEICARAKRKHVFGILHRKKFMKGGEAKHPQIVWVLNNNLLEHNFCLWLEKFLQFFSRFEGTERRFCHAKTMEAASSSLSRWNQYGTQHKQSVQ